MDRVRRTIKFDGLIQLQCVDGYLCGAGIEGSRLYLRSPAVSETGDEVFPFFHFSPNVFKVVPTLSSLDNAAKLMNRAAKDGEKSESGDGNGVLSSHMENTLAQQEITYGMVFSLVHAASNLYVSVVYSQRSQNDPDCVSVVLTPPSSANSPSCEFTFVSRYKIHSEGDKVTRDDELLIRLAAKPLFLHVSSPRELDVCLSPEDVAVLDRTFRLGSRLSFHKVPQGSAKQQQIMGSPGWGAGVNNNSFSLSFGAGVSATSPFGKNSPMVLQALTREHLDEVNGCEEGGVSFTLHRYDAEVDKALAQKAQLHLNHTYIPCGVPMAFFHRERESFLTTSVTAPRLYISHASALVDSMDEPPRLRQRKPRGAGQVVALTGSEGQVHEMALQGDAANEGRSGSVQMGEDGVLRATPKPSTEQEEAADQAAAAMFVPPGTPGISAAVSAVPSTAYSQRSEKAANARIQRRITGLIDGGSGQLLPFPTFAISPQGSADEEASESVLAESCNINALWMIEGADPSHGGPVKVGNTYRIKHIYTGLYLAVCGSAVDDIFQDEDELSDGHLASEHGDSMNSSLVGETGEALVSGLREKVSAVNTPALSFRQAAMQPAFRETALCLIMEPRSQKDLERSLFTFEYMFNNDATYLFEQESIVMKNLLTGMYVATDNAVSGPNIRLKLQWQHRASDTIVATTVPVDFQRSALFIRQQCIWLSRFREQMQAAAVDLQRDTITLKRAAEAGNERAAAYLKMQDEDTQQILKDLENSSSKGDPDLQLLEEHKRRSLAEFRKKRKNKKKKKPALTLGPDGGNKTPVPGGSMIGGGAMDDDDDEEVEHMHPRYRSLQHTIRLCQRSLTTLTCFCTKSSDPNPITREGLPIKENQRMLFDIQLYRLLFEVIMAPFCLLHETYEQATMIQNPRDFDELGSYEGTALYQTIVQRQSTDRLWDESAALPGAAANTRLPPLPLTGGVIRLDEINHPIHAEIHLLCRLAFRLLRQMILEDSALADGWEVYLPHCLALDGRRLHVIEVLQEMFTDNPRIGIKNNELVANHFISATKSIPRSAYLKFLGAACSIGDKGCRPRQQLMCQKLLVENPQLLSKFVMDPNGKGLCVVLNVGNGAPVPFGEFFTDNRDPKMVDFVHGQMRLMTRLCFDGCTEECIRRVSSLLPEEGMRMALRNIWTNCSNSTTRPPSSGSLDYLRAQLIRLSFLTYVWPRMSRPKVQVRARTVLFGSSKLRADPNCLYLSGEPDDEMTALVKHTTLAILRANPFLVQGDDARNELIRTCVSVWLRCVECKQYTRDEIQQVIPLFLRLLDGSQDVISSNRAAVQDVEAEEKERFELSAESIPLMVIRELMCKCLLGSLRNEMFRSADEIVVFLHHVYTKGMRKEEPKPWMDVHHNGDRTTMVGMLVDSLAKEGRELQDGLQKGISHSVGAIQGVFRKDGYRAVQSDESDQDEDDVRAPLRSRHHSDSSSGAEPSDRYYRVTPNDIEAYIDLMVERIHAIFCPTRLAPLLMNVTRYQRKSLTVHSMRLLVQLCIVKKTIAQQVLMVNTLPCKEVMRGFDATYEIAVDLKNAFAENNTYHPQKWQRVIEAATDFLVKPFDDGTTEMENEKTQSSASFSREREFLHLYSSLGATSGSVSSITTSESLTESPTGKAVSSPLSPRRARAVALWSKLAVVTRMMVFRNTVSRRRRAMGIFDGSETSLDLTVRADFMSHFKVHETLIRMLPTIPPESDAYFYTIQFFYLFSLAESTAKVLQPFIDTFVAAVDASPRTHVMCLHIVVNILHIMGDINDYLTPALMLAFVKQIDSQVLTKLPDCDFVEHLSNRVFLKTSVSVVNRRRMMLLLRQQKTLRQLSNPPQQPSPAEVNFISALVNLMCNVCGCHVSVLILARGLLPSESICKMVERRLRRNKNKLLRSDKTFRHVTDSETVSFKMLNPYVRALVALYLTSTDDNDEDCRRRQQEWMNNDSMWNIFKYYVVVLREATRLMREGNLRGGKTADTNAGVAGIMLYRIFFLKTVPISVAAFFTNCYDRFIYFEKRNAANAEPSKEQTGCMAMGTVLRELIQEMLGYSEMLLTLDEGLSLAPSEVVNVRAAIGILLVVAQTSEMENESQQCRVAMQNMCQWLARRQQTIESRLQAEEELNGRNDAESDDDDDCMDGKESEEGMFEVLVKVEHVSSTLQKKESGKKWRRSPRSSRTGRRESGDKFTVTGSLSAMKSVAKSAAGFASGTVVSMESRKDVLTEVQERLRDLLQGDELIPMVEEGPSTVALIVNNLLLHSLEDRVARQCVKRVLKAMMDRLFTARTFVGLLNLFYNALHCALYHPKVVDTVLYHTKKERSPLSAFLDGDILSSFSAEAVQTLTGMRESAGITETTNKLYGANLQIIFSDLGMMEVVVTLSGVEDDVVALNALRVATALLDGGNRRVQKALFNYFETREEGFFHNIRHILRKNVEFVQYVNSDHQYYLLKRGLQGASAGLGSTSMATINMQLVQALRPRGPNALTCIQDPDDNRRMGWSKVCGLRRLSLIWEIYRLLQLFCEGHNTGMQNYIRTQHDNLHTANMIHESMLLMHELTHFVTPANLPVITQGFELLTECCQGPCHTNQEAVIDFGVCGMMTRVLCLAREMEKLRNEAERDGVAAYQFDDYVSEEDLGELRKSIGTTALSLIEGCRDPEFLEKVLLQFPLQVVRDEIALIDPREHYYIANNDNEEDDPAAEALYQWLIFLKTIQPHVNEEDAQEIAKVLDGCSELTNYIGRVEVSREADVEVVYFRIPPLCTSLTDDRKDVLLWQVDRTSRATKLSDFLQKSDELIFSMEQLFAFRQALRRWTRFRITYDSNATVSFLVKAKIFFNEYVAALFFSHQISYYEQISMIIAVMVNCILTMVEGDTSDRLALLQKYQGPVVATLCVMQTIVCIAILFIDLIVGYPIHLYIQYKEKQRFTTGEAKLNVTIAEVYAGLTFKERITTLLTWFVFQLRVFFVVMAALSVFVSPYFAAFNLMLLIYKISTLRTFITAITMNGKQLLLTSFLGLIILYLFSIVGFLVFSSEFNPDDDGTDPVDPDENNCETLLRCFVYIFSQGLRAGGGVADVMKPWGWGESDIVPRVNYDILFYVLVNVVYLNIMFGIIIDTFGQMRDEKREKEADMHGMCFICGLESDTLEKITPSGFHIHVKHEHNMWMYLYFMHHLRRKDVNAYTGQESYVHAKIQASRLCFFPNQCCISLMELNKREEANVSSDEDDDEEEEEDVNTKGGAGSGGERAGGAAAAAGGKALVNATRELTTLKDQLNNALKDLSSDTQRLKGALQQLELAAKGGGSLLGDSASAAGGPPPSQGRQSVGTRRFMQQGGAGGPGMYAGSERGSQHTAAFSQHTGAFTQSQPHQHQHHHPSGGSPLEEGSAAGARGGRGGGGGSQHHSRQPPPPE